MSWRKEAERVTEWEERARLLADENGAADPEQVAERLGYGDAPEVWTPVQWKRVLEAMQGQMATETAERWKDVVLRRAGDTTAQMQRGEPVINLSHRVKRHSPTGMEWGYSGSGPADLALNVLLAYGFDPDEVDNRYQRFKAEVVAQVPREGGRLSREMVEAWWREADRDEGAGDDERVQASVSIQQTQETADEGDGRQDDEEQGESTAS